MALVMGWGPRVVLLAFDASTERHCRLKRAKADGSAFSEATVS